MVMPFGLTNAPSAFQRFMNNIFSDLLNVTVIIYLDNILIYSDNPSKHKEHVCKVLCRLQKYSLYCCPDKCKFSVNSVEYLGLKINFAKIQTIMDWLEPRKVEDIQSFLGFSSFYCHFISNYSKIVVLLTHLTHKGTQWNFTDEAWKSFNALKSTFTSTPVLANWEPNKPLIVETDASNYALGAILSIISNSGNIHPGTFTSPKQNYDTHGKELLTIFDAFWVWQHYLEGSGMLIDVVTNHKNLEHFSTTKILTRRQVWWSKFLSRFNLIIRFHPGQLGTKPNSLTRWWDIYPKGENSDYATINPNNLCPIFTDEQLTNSLHATKLADPVLYATVIMDQEQLHRDNLQSLPSDSLFISHSFDPKPHWSITPNDFLHHKSLIYVPDSSDLHLYILWYMHDHILSRHPGQNKIVSLFSKTIPALDSVVP